MIVSQLHDPQWKARWIGMEGQGAYDPPILPAFRKGGEPGGWQRVKILEPGAGCCDLEYESRDEHGGRGDLDDLLGVVAGLLALDRTASLGREIPNDGELTEMGT